jgi:hypothetical protein
MGKRSNFERVERDYYPTPFAAVAPLIPHLKRHGVESFAEPCAGDDSLVNHLRSYGLKCAYNDDIAHGADALRRTHFPGEAIITNPPYTRPVMHAMIDHFRRISPTWLLMEWDWAATKQAEPHMQFCTHVVIVGRLKLIPGSPHFGKENFAWYRFQSFPAQPKLYPRSGAIDWASDSSSMRAASSSSPPASTSSSSLMTVRPSSSRRRSRRSSVPATCSVDD